MLIKQIQEELLLKEKAFAKMLDYIGRHEDSLREEELEKYHISNNGSVYLYKQNGEKIRISDHQKKKRRGITKEVIIE